MPPAPILTKNPQVKTAIVEALRAGNTIDASAGHARVSVPAVYSWLARGRAELARVQRTPGGRLKASEAPFVEFLEDVEGAQADAECRVVALLQNRIPDEWRAAAWWLERRHRHRWGREDRIEHTGRDGGPISVEVQVSARDELLQRLEQMRTRLVEPAAIEAEVIE